MSVLQRLPGTDRDWGFSGDALQRIPHTALVVRTQNAATERDRSGRPLAIRILLLAAGLGRNQPFRGDILAQPQPAQEGRNRVKDAILA